MPLRGVEPPRVSFSPQLNLVAGGHVRCYLARGLAWGPRAGRERRERSDAWAVRSTFVRLSSKHGPRGKRRNAQHHRCTARCWNGRRGDRGRARDCAGGSVCDSVDARPSKARRAAARRDSRRCGLRRGANPAKARPRRRTGGVRRHRTGQVAGKRAGLVRTARLWHRAYGDRPLIP
jgi:hypothetical protein